MISELGNPLKSQGYKVVFLTKYKEQMLAAFEDGILTPIFVFYQDKPRRINIGHFGDRGGDCAEIGFLETVDIGNLLDIFVKIERLREEIQTQEQIPYLDELMRWKGYFTNPAEIIKIYVKKFGYSLYVYYTIKRKELSICLAII